MPLDYRPDFAEDTPGMLTAIVDMMPTARGYKVWHYPVAQTAHTLTLGASEGEISSLFATRWLSTPGGIVIAGTDKDLYVYDFTNGFIKVSKAGGYNLVGSTYQYGEDALSAFDHCAFGDVLIATHRSTYPQYRNALDRTIATLYANLGTTVAAPKAAVCAAVNNFVFLGDLSGTWGSSTTETGTRDMVAWCGIGDHQNWDITPTSSEGSFQQFVDTPGPITALAPFGDGLIVFKSASMYYGTYVGAGSTNSPVWQFTRISNRIGCIGHRSWTDIGGKLVFVGLEDAYVFDGTRPRSITDGIWETHFKNLTNYGGVFPMWVGHDKVNNCVMFRRADNGGANLLWSYRYDKWSVLQTILNGTAIPNGGYQGHDIFCKTNVNDFRTVTSTQSSGTVGTDHYDLYTMFACSITRVSGIPTVCQVFNRFNVNGYWSSAASLTTGAIGDDWKVSKFTRVTPKWAMGVVPVNTTVTMDRKDYLGAFWTAGSTSVTQDGRFRYDLLSLGNTSTPWARFTIAMPSQQGEEILDIGITKVAAGTK